MKEIAYIMYEHKIAAIITAIGGSAALSYFMSNYDLGHSIFGLLGFIVAWALRKSDDVEDDKKTAIQWVAKLILSLILPVMLTNGAYGIVVKVVPVIDHVIVSFFIGTMPEAIITIIKKYINKKTA